MKWQVIKKELTSLNLLLDEYGNRLAWKNNSSLTNYNLLNELTQADKQEPFKAIQHKLEKYDSWWTPVKWFYRLFVPIEKYRTLYYFSEIKVSINILLNQDIPLAQVNTQIELLRKQTEVGFKNVSHFSSLKFILQKINSFFNRQDTLQISYEPIEKLRQARLKLNQVAENLEQINSELPGVLNNLSSNPRTRKNQISMLENDIKGVSRIVKKIQTFGIFNHPENIQQNQVENIEHQNSNLAAHSKSAPKILL